MLPYLIPVGIIMLHFLSYARLCVHPMTCVSQIGEACTRFVIKKELVHAFSCTYIELWMHLESLESTQEARVALGYASSNFYVAAGSLESTREATLPSCSPNFLRASITRYTHAKHEPILNYNIASVHPYLIPVCVIMLNFSTYAQPCVHPMTCVIAQHGTFNIPFGWLWKTDW